MVVDIQKAAIRRLLDTQDTDFYNKLVNKFFSDTNLLLFTRIRKFYEQHMRIPSAAEFYESQVTTTYKEYLDNHIFTDVSKADTLSSDFLADQLQDWFIREETIKFLDEFIEQLEFLERTEIIDKIQNHVLSLHNFLPEGNVLFDVGTMEVVPEDGAFTMFPSGLNRDYDAINGGFGLEELIMFGGRRGSGKSIITLNCAKHQFINNNNSVAFFSIEMRRIEVYYRLMSMLSKVPFLKFLRNELSEADKLVVAKSKLDAFYEPSEETNQAYDNLVKTGNFQEFNLILKQKRIPLKQKRFHIIDDPSLTIPQIDHWLNLLQQRHDLRVGVVDYLNIIKTEDSLDWKSQIKLADNLKLLSRKYGMMVLTPYQIDASGEARFAKGVLDSADRSFRFTPADLTDNPNVLPFEITKIRNGKSMKFDVNMDWDCVSITSDSNPAVVGEKILNKYGNDTKEQPMDAG